VIHLLIDLQPGFAAAKNDTLIDNINHCLKNAICNKDTIVLLQYDRHGNTFYKITRHLKGYDKKLIVWKDGDDGAVTLYDKLFENNINDNCFRVYGVCAKYCLKSTVQTLSVIMPDATIELVKSGIGCVSKNINFNWSKKLKNVRVV
jgi:hypothetical protein